MDFAIIVHLNKLVSVEKYSQSWIISKPVKGGKHGRASRSLTPSRMLPTFSQARVKQREE